MHKIEANPEKNRLILHLNGCQRSQRESFVIEIERLSAKLAPGFSCIISLSKYTIFSGKDLQDLQCLLYAYGSRTIVYVEERKSCGLPEADAGACSSADIRVFRAATLEAAENLLSGEIVQEVDR